MSLLVEHTFITTREAEDVFDKVDSVLAQLQFEVEGRVEKSVVFVRGKKKPVRFSRLENLPQKIELFFDRGRVVVAASIIPFGKAELWHRKFLLEVASTIESVLIPDDDQRRLPSSELVATLVEVQKNFDEQQAKKKRRNHWTTSGCLVAFFVFICFVIWIAVSFGRN